MVTALTLIEQIEKRGEHGWIEPLVEDMGAWMLLQLGDVANLLEVVLKYVFTSFLDALRTRALGMNCSSIPIVSTNGASHARPHTHLVFLQLPAWRSA